MKKQFLILVVLLLYSSLLAQSYSSIILPDSTVEKIVACSSIKQDSFKQLINNDNVLNKMSKAEIKSILNIFHQNEDEVYIQNKETYTIAQTLIKDYINKHNETLIFCKYYAGTNSEYVESNLTIYLSRVFFQIFYEKGRQDLLIRTDIQEAMKPNIIKQMLEKTMDQDALLEDLKFIAKHSKNKLYTL